MVELTISSKGIPFQSKMALYFSKRLPKLRRMSWSYSILLVSSAFHYCLLTACSQTRSQNIGQCTTRHPHLRREPGYRSCRMSMLRLVNWFPSACLHLTVANELPASILGYQLLDLSLLALSSSHAVPANRNFASCILRYHWASTNCIYLNVFS